MRKRKRAIAMIMAMLLLFPAGGCAKPEPDDALMTKDNQEEGDIVLKEENVKDASEKGAAFAICAAEYPEMAQYPETDGFTYDAEAYEEWRASLMAQRPEDKEYQNGIREFYEVTAQEFLKDTKGKNRVYSPLNVYMALAMLAETTDGETREQILELLHVESIETLRNNAGILWNANYCDDGTVTSVLASSAWLSNSINYHKETMESLAKYYYASSFSGNMGSAEYNKMLQDWLNEQTGGLLEEQASQVEMNPETVLALATTVCFRAKWANEFREGNTTEDIFHTPSEDMTCEFMHQSGTNNYYWGENFGAISRRLENSGNMLLILPDEDVAVEELLTDAEVLEFIYDNYEWENRKTLIVNQAVPKFDVVSDYSLIEGLKNLGVTKVFDFNESDFTPLTTDTEVAVEQATHAARVMIDEEGCTAVAFTVMLAAGAARPPEETMDFVLNRPFLFVINGQDGQPLFIGIVNQPK